MPTAHQKPIKTTFGSGEIDPKAHGRKDTQQYADGAKRIRNFRLLEAGGIARRPGSIFLAALQPDTRIEDFGTTRIMAFSPGRFDVYDRGGGWIESVGSCPWVTTAQVFELDYVFSNGEAYITHPNLPTQIISRGAADDYSLIPFEYAAGITGELLQPYRKFAGPQVTIQPTNVAGSVTVTSNSAPFSPLHVGTRLRYYGREMLIDGFVNASTVTADIVTRLYPSLRLTVTSSQGFNVGDVVEGSTTGVKGEVRAVVDATTVDVVMTTGYDFITTADDLIGPRAKTAISNATGTSPLPVTQWQEQAFSPLRGYPRCVAIHANRLVFGGSPSLPDCILLSRVGIYNDFDLGEGEDNEAIFEFIGSSPTGVVSGLHSGRQLIIRTSASVHYIPETDSNPIRPTSVRFPRLFRVGSQRRGAGLFDDGIVFTALRGKRIHQSVPRAQSSVLDPYQFTDASLLASHLITGVRHAAFEADPIGITERYGYFVMQDGTMAVLHSIADQNVRGWALWTTAGSYRSVAAVGGEIFVVTERTINGATVHWLERLDYAIPVDAAVEVADASGLAPHLANDTARVTAEMEDWGDVAVDASGGFSLPVHATGPFHVGLPYSSLVETLPPVIGLPGGGVADGYMRIASASIMVHESATFDAEGYALAIYPAGADLSLAPPPNTGSYEFTFLGWEKDPTITIEEPHCLPLTLLAISSEVYYHGD